MGIVMKGEQLIDEFMEVHDFLGGSGEDSQVVVPPPDHFRVWAGQAQETGQWRDVEKFYCVNTPVGPPHIMGNDLGILIVRDEFELGKSVIGFNELMSETEMKAAMTSRTVCRIITWSIKFKGKHKPDLENSIMTECPVETMNTTSCAAFLSAEITAINNQSLAEGNLMCVLPSATNEDQCHGVVVPGSPVICSKKLLGIVSLAKDPALLDTFPFQTRMDFPEETPAPKTSVWSEFEPGHSDTSLPDFTFLERLRQMQWAVKLIVIYDLLINVGFHVISILVLIDLHALNETGKCSLVLDAPYYDNKAHFWTLYGCCLDLNLNTTSVLLWGLLIFAIGKGDPTWAKAWVMMKRIVIFVMLPPIAAIAFGGETTLAIFSSIFFLFYYLLSVLTIEVITRYFIPPENTELAQTPLLPQVRASTFTKNSTT
ncbi:hypothetical protein GE061_012240 [Apolygus lucorum]|uniref:Uncharacterized protein n=1 Tax=Apolygus lucorum TaxID=248454 RepID=A0A8S9XVT8_APOLU|nr:hypothetical protein GE061_012240 [Apolygus lucorum]